MDTASVKVSDSLAKSINDTADSRFLQEASSKMLDLRQSDLNVLEYIMKKMQDPSTSEAQITSLQYLLQKRTQISATISNMLRTLGEAAQRIIQNLR